MSPWDKRERASGWYPRWVEPVIEALYTRQLTEARQLLYAGRHAISQGELPTGEASQKAGVLLDYMEYHIDKVIDSVAALEQCPDYAARLSRPLPDPWADGLRRKLLLQFRISAERIGYEDLEVGEFQELYDNVPEQERNDEFWHFVSTWAFTHFHRSILEQAYEEFSINRGGFMTDWLWWRVRLMYRLLAERAGEGDVRQLILNLTITEHLRDFERVFLSALRQAELWNPVFAELLELRRVAIEGASQEEIKRVVEEKE